jgi:DNA-binding MarR family transcriptional regulator
MNDMSDEKRQIGYDLLDLIMTFLELDKQIRNYGTDVPIFHAEIHMISAIAGHPGIHVGGLADLLGITKGSVSEIVRKLEKKGLVMKETDERNLSKLSLYLTEKGKTAHENHMRYHALLNDTIESELAGVSEREVQFLSHFLAAITEKAKNFDEYVE